jgi:hypothetical protein
MSGSDHTPLHNNAEEENVDDSFLSPEEMIRAATSSYLEQQETTATATTDSAPIIPTKTRKESPNGTFPKPPTLERLPNLRSVTPGAFREGGNSRTASSTTALIPPVSRASGDLERGWNDHSQQQQMMNERSHSPTGGDDETNSHSEDKPVLEATLVVDDIATTSHGTSTSDEERPPIYPAEPIETTIIDGHRTDGDNSVSSKSFRRCVHPSKNIIALLIIAMAITIAAVGVAVSEMIREQNHQDELDQLKSDAGSSSDDPAQHKIAAGNPYQYFEPYDRITQHVALLVLFRPKECQTNGQPKITFTCLHDENRNNSERREGIMIEISTGLTNCQKMDENSAVCDFDLQQAERMLLNGELVRSRASALFTCGTFATNYNNATDQATAIVEISGQQGYYCDNDQNDLSRTRIQLSQNVDSESHGPGTNDLVTLLGLGRLCNPAYIKYLDQVFHAISAEDCLDSEVFSSGVILTEYHQGYSLSSLTDLVTYCYNNDSLCSSNNGTDCKDNAVQKVTAIDPLNVENCQAESYTGIQTLIDQVSRESDIDRIIDYQDELVLRWLVDNDYHHLNPNATDYAQR